MATKMPKALAKKAKVNAPEVNDLEVLHPEREILLGGKTYTIREYENIEWMRLLVKAEPLVVMLAAFVSSQQKKYPSFEDMLLIFSEHFDSMLPMLLQSAGMTLEEYKQLEPSEMEALLSVWWGTNYHFFLLRAQARVSIQAVEKMSAQQALEKFTQSSSPTGTSLATSSTTPAVK